MRRNSNYRTTQVKQNAEMDIICKRCTSSLFLRSAHGVAALESLDGGAWEAEYL